jgi:hypothetical protein
MAPRTPTTVNGHLAGTTALSQRVGRFSAAAQLASKTSPTK